MRALRAYPLLRALTSFQHSYGIIQTAEQQNRKGGDHYILHSLLAFSGLFGGILFHLLIKAVEHERLLSDETAVKAQTIFPLLY